jgi:hypothetical protein
LRRPLRTGEKQDGNRQQPGHGERHGFDEAFEPSLLARQSP